MPPKKKQPPKPECPERHRLRIQLITIGPSQEHKDKLVKFVTDTCQTPHQWPLTDSERISFLRQCYEHASRAKRAEYLEKKLNEPQP